MGTHADIGNVADTYHTGDFTYGQYDCGAFVCLCLNRSGNGIGVSSGTASIWQAARSQNAVVWYGSIGSFPYGKVTRGDIVLTSNASNFGCYPTQSHAQVALGSHSFISSWGNNGPGSAEPHRHSSLTGGNAYAAICRWGSVNGKTHRYGSGTKQKARSKKNKVVAITKKPRQAAHVGQPKKDGNKVTVTWKYPSNVTSKHNSARMTSQLFRWIWVTQKLDKKTGKWGKKVTHHSGWKTLGAKDRSESTTRFAAKDYYPSYYSKVVFYKRGKQVTNKKTIARLKKMTAKQLKKKGYTKKTKQVQHLAQIVSISAEVKAKNKVGTSNPTNSSKFVYHNPDEPKISVSYDGGQVSFTITAEKNDGSKGSHRQRTDTAWALYGSDSIQGLSLNSEYDRKGRMVDTKALEKKKDGTFKGTKKVVRYDVNYFNALQLNTKVKGRNEGSAANDWIHLQMRAYNRGTGGKSSTVKKDYYIGEPQGVWIETDGADDTTETSKKIVTITSDAHAYKNIYVPLHWDDASKHHPISFVQLQRLTNVTYAKRSKIPASASWTDVEGAKSENGVHPVGLYDSAALAIPDRGKYLWYRLEYGNDVFTVYSEAVRAVKLEKPNITPGKISTMTLSPTDDGKGIKVDSTWGQPSTDNDGGTPGEEISWSEYQYAWHSSSTPSTMNADWTDTFKELTANEFDPGTENTLYEVTEQPSGSTINGKAVKEYDIAWVPAEDSTDAVKIASKAWVYMKKDQTDGSEMVWAPLKKSISYIAGVSEGETYYVNGRRYIEPIQGDTTTNSDTTYGDYYRDVSNPLSIEVCKSPGVVTLTAPSAIRRTDALLATWTHTTDAVQKAWTMYIDPWVEVTDDDGTEEFPEYDSTHVASVNELVKSHPEFGKAYATMYNVDWMKENVVYAVLRHAGTGEEETVSLAQDVSYKVNEGEHSVVLLDSIAGHTANTNDNIPGETTASFTDYIDATTLQSGTEHELDYTPVALYDVQGVTAANEWHTLSDATLTETKTYTSKKGSFILNTKDFKAATSHAYVAQTVYIDHKPDSGTIAITADLAWSETTSKRKVKYHSKKNYALTASDFSYPDKKASNGKYYVTISMNGWRKTCIDNQQAVPIILNLTNVNVSLQVTSTTEPKGYSVDLDTGTITFTESAVKAYERFAVRYSALCPYSVKDLCSSSSVEKEVIAESCIATVSERKYTWKIKDIDDLSDGLSLATKSLQKPKLYYVDAYGNQIGEVDDSLWTWSEENHGGQTIRFALSTNINDDGEYEGAYIYPVFEQIESNGADGLQAMWTGLVGATYSTKYKPITGTVPTFWYIRNATAEEIASGDVIALEDGEETPVGYQAGHRVDLVSGTDYFYDWGSNTVQFSDSADGLEIYADYTTTDDLEVLSLRMSYTPAGVATLYAAGETCTYNGTKYRCLADTTVTPEERAGTVIADGTDAYGATQFTTDRLKEILGTGTQLKMHVGIRTSLTGTEVYSNSTVTTVADPPSVGVSCVSTLLSQPLELDLTSTSPNATAILRIESDGVTASEPDGYHVQAAGDVVWTAVLSSGTLNWYRDSDSDEMYHATYTLPVTRELVDLCGYTVYCTGKDEATELQGDETSCHFDVRWSHQAVAPNAYVRTRESEKYAAIDVMAGDGNDIRSDDTVEIYRVTPDSVELIADGLDYNTTVIDRFAPYAAIHSYDEDYGVDLTYRVATRTVDGDVNWDDIDYELFGYQVRFDWGDGDNDPTNGEGGTLEVKWNIDKSDKYSKEFESRLHWDGRRMGYWNKGAARTISIKTDVTSSGDAETQRLLKVLGRYDGPVFVRTPFGDAFEANVEVSGMDYTHNNPMAGVTIDATELALDDGFKVSSTDISVMTED